MIDKMQVGIITSTHGIKGEVKVFPTTDDPKRFKKLKTVLLENQKEAMQVTIEQVKFLKNMVIIKFKEFNDINEVEGFRQCPLMITRDQAVPCGENENFIADLIDMEVVTDEGNKLGIFTDVLQSRANDVYIIKTEEGKEVLIPAIPDCILKVDLEKNCMTVHLLKGLLDL